MTSAKFNQCLERIRNCDKRGIVTIYNEYYSKMILTAEKKLHTADAQDIASSFIQYLLEKSHDIGYIDNPDAWINQSIRNRAVNFIRKDSRNIYLSECAEEAFAVDEDKNFHCFVKQSIESLNDYQKELFSLHYQQGYKYREISVMLNRPIGTIKSDINIIKTNLHDLKKYL